MNKKKLALTLLLSSMSVSVVAAEVVAPVVVAEVVAPVVVAEVVAPVAAPVAAVGYFSSAWSAVKSNRAMTAALVTTCILLGAVVNAAVSNNNEVDADNAE